MNAMNDLMPSPLKSVDAALAQLLAAVEQPLAAETVATFDADRRVLACDVLSQLNVPAFDNSAMDGYAVACVDVTEEGTALLVSQRIAAGSAADVLEPGTAARIFTGAPVPEGADAVVMQEHCTAHDDGSVSINTVPTPSQSIRLAGEDVAAGSVVLRKGDRLTPAALGLAASIGLHQLSVVRRPRVALFSTGDELVTPGEVAPADMPPGAIYNSNRFFLHALLLRLGCEVTDLGIVPDNFDATVSALQAAAEGHDVILTSGGVSVGEEDHLRLAVELLGSLDLWRIAIKPGKPFAYGTVGNSHFIGLPGNPVSSFVTFLVLVRPFLLKLQGVPKLAPSTLTVRAHFDWPRADKRREYLRVRRDTKGGLELFEQQGSNVLTSAVWGDGLVDNPPGTTIAQGDAVRFIPFTELFT